MALVTATRSLPLLAVILLGLYLLALSAVKPRQNFFGSLLGMIIPVGTVASPANWLVVNLF